MIARAWRRADRGPVPTRAAAPGRGAERCRGRRWHGGRRVPGRGRRRDARRRAARSPRRPAPASRSTVPTRPASSPRCRPPASWPCSTSWPPTAPRWPPPCRTSRRSPGGWRRARSTRRSTPLKPPPDNLILGPTPQADALTITVGLGASMFDDRYGLADRRPTRLVEMPAFPNDQLAPERSHGDLVVQICGGTNETCIHALRRLMRATRDSMVVRWMVPGFNQPNTLGPGRTSTRNLLGFKDGTANLDPADAAADGRPRLGARRRGRAGVGGRRQLPRGAHHPHAGGVLGPDAAAHAGDDHRAPQGHRRAPRRDRRDRRPGLRRRSRGRAVPAGRPHPPGQPPHPGHGRQPDPAPRASPTPSASTRPATSTRACCSSASSATSTPGS